MKRILTRIIPGYAVLPTLICLAVDMLVFYGSRLVTVHFHHYDLSISADSAIPFVPAFMVIYVLAYVQWIFGFIIIGRESREFCHKFLAAEIVSKLLCLVVFLLLPTVMERPEITGTDIFSRLTAFIYSADTPDNLFPSIHCFSSVFFAAAAVCSEKTPAWYKWAGVAFTVFVCASVVLVKQHVTLDILGGIALAVIGPALSHLLHAERMFGFLNRTREEE